MGQAMQQKRQEVVSDVGCVSAGFHWPARHAVVKEDSRSTVAVPLRKELGDSELESFNV